MSDGCLGILRWFRWFCLYSGGSGCRFIGFLAAGVQQVPGQAGHLGAVKAVQNGIVVIMEAGLGQHAAACHILARVESGQPGRTYHAKPVIAHGSGGFGVPVAFPFGYGLSYTSFAYSNLQAASNGVTLTVTNTGKRAGAEIVQLYVAKPGAEVFRPAQELKGFA